MRRQERRSVARRNAECLVLGWAVWDRYQLFEARTDEVSILGGANQQGGDRWMLVVHVSGPLRLQPELFMPKQLEAALLH